MEEMNEFVMVYLHRYTQYKDHCGCWLRHDQRKIGLSKETNTVTTSNSYRETGRDEPIGIWVLRSMF